MAMDANAIASKMPAGLGGLYAELWQSVAWIHLKWNQFKAVFAKEQIPLLAESAPAFFADLQRTLWEDALLHLCRLTDPPESARKPTLTIKRIPSLIDDNGFQREV